MAAPWPGLPTSGALLSSDRLVTLYTPTAADLRWGAVVGLAVGLWFLALGLVLVSTRVRGIEAAAASQDLPGDEPPAIVSYLAAGWSLTEDAPESTLLDLAARGYLELRQPGADPRQTTIHVTTSGGRPTGNPARVASTAPAELTAYERRVLDRVLDLAAGGVVPLTALTFRNEGGAARWLAGFEREVEADARTRGFSRRRIPHSAVLALNGAAAVVGAVASAAALAVAHDHEGLHLSEDTLGAVIGAGFVAYVLLGGLAARIRGERDTAAGREAAARWLGLRAYLRVDEAFAALPPAAVAVWDRYLAYGDALGVNRICTAVIDLGLGNRRQVWSSAGGGWHQVRVRYPLPWGRYGAGAPWLLFTGAVWAGLGYLVLRWRTVVDPLVPSDLRWLLLLPWLLGLLGLGLGAHRIIRTVTDLARPVQLTGEVLWMAPWRHRGSGNERRTIVHYLAVDDGGGDRTTAWALRSPWVDRCAPGDAVEVTVRPWSRRVTTLTRLTARPVDGSATTGTTTTGTTAAAGQVPGQAADLPGADQVSAALGLPVAEVSRVRTPVSFAVFARAGANGSRDVHLGALHGPAGTLALAAARRLGTPEAGIGQEAYLGTGWGVARQGGTVAEVRLGPQLGGVPPQAVEALLHATLRQAPPETTTG